MSDYETFIQTKAQAALNLEATEEVVAVASPRLFEMDDAELEEVAQ